MLSMWGKSAGESEIVGWERRLAGAQADSERENHVSLAPQHSHEALGLVFSQALDYAGPVLLYPALFSLVSSLFSLGFIALHDARWLAGRASCLCPHSPSLSPVQETRPVTKRDLFCLCLSP